MLVSCRCISVGLLAPLAMTLLVIANIGTLQTSQWLPIAMSHEGVTRCNHPLLPKICMCNSHVLFVSYLLEKQQSSGCVSTLQIIETYFSLSHLFVVCLSAVWWHCSRDPAASTSGPIMAGSRTTYLACNKPKLDWMVNV